MSYWKLNCLNFRSLCSRGPTSMLSLPAELTHQPSPPRFSRPQALWKLSSSLRASGHRQPSHFFLTPCRERCLPASSSSAQHPHPQPALCALFTLHWLLHNMKMPQLYSPPNAAPQENAPFLPHPSLFYNSGPYSRTFCPARAFLLTPLSSGLLDSLALQAALKKASHIGPTSQHVHFHCLLPLTPPSPSPALSVSRIYSPFPLLSPVSPT